MSLLDLNNQLHILIKFGKHVIAGPESFAGIQKSTLVNDFFHVKYTMLFRASAEGRLAAETWHMFLNIRFNRMLNDDAWYCNICNLLCILRMLNLK